MKVEYIIAIAVALAVITFFILKRNRRNKLPVGMQVFNSSGQVVFDSSTSNRYARIVDSIDIKLTNSRGPKSGSYSSTALKAEMAKGLTPFFLTNRTSFFNDYDNGREFIYLENDGTLRWKMLDYRSQIIKVSLGVF